MIKFNDKYDRQRQTNSPVHDASFGVRTNHKSSIAFYMTVSNY